ncbi:DUF1405 domain-containing protein [Metabacillus sp. KIGAM252]|uniref:DUF1405 domain-containing protein n=1 Tax=Metabacillus flavus TaxID=2823519 RepID=A0ABS5LF80_9BACI|nr:DUF1405 domain-containing protein [Metabacillus flavus]MBS2969390.1 DUF1405 domain-containing protein [Metabacillus flavus]
MKTIYYVLAGKPFLFLLFAVNLLGTLYGYYWYTGQLVITAPQFLIFVPDSPTASLFFTIVILYYLFGKRSPLMEALAVVTLFKYGIWATVMNLLLLITTGELEPTGYMLMASHTAMAIQGLLYIPFYRFKLRHLIIAAVWTLHNDVIDYVFGQMPIYYSLMDYLPAIGYFTFWLSILSLGIAYLFVIKEKRLKLDIL